MVNILSFPQKKHRDCDSHIQGSKEWSFLMSCRGKEKISVRDCSCQGNGTSGAAWPSELCLPRSRRAEQESGSSQGCAKEQRAALHVTELWARGLEKESKKPSREMAYI